MPDDPTDDLDAVSEARDDRKLPIPNGKGRFLKGHKALPGAGRPIEVAHKARRSLMRGKAWSVLTEVVAGTLEISPTRLRAIELLLDRGYGRAVDVQAHLHLMGPAGGESQIFEGVSAAVLTHMVRQMTLGVQGAQTPDTAPMLQRVIDPPPGPSSLASPATSLATAEPKASEELDIAEVLPPEPTDT